MTSPPAPHPADRVIQRFAPGLSAERHALARTRLEALADVLARIAIRQAREEQEGGDSCGAPAQGKMADIPPGL